MRTVAEVLDRVKQVQKVKSDYKLGLCLGIGESSLANYRHGRSFPDEKTCQILAVAMGEDPIILMVEMHAQRTKDDDSRAMWTTLARRLQMGFSSLAFLVMVAIFSVAATALPARASTVSAPAYDAASVYYVNQAKQAVSLFSRYFVKICEFVSRVCQMGNFSRV